MDDILPILKEGRWLTASEALEYGFIDEIVEDGTKLNFDDAMKTRFNMFHLPALPAVENRTVNPDEENAPGWFNNFVNKFLKPQVQKEEHTNALQAQNKNTQSFNSTNEKGLSESQFHLENRGCGS